MLTKNLFCLCIDPAQPTARYGTPATAPTFFHGAAFHVTRPQTPDDIATAARHVLWSGIVVCRDSGRGLERLRRCAGRQSTGRERDRGERTG